MWRGLRAVRGCIPASARILDRLPLPVGEFLGQREPREPNVRERLPREANVDAGLTFFDLRLPVQVTVVEATHDPPK